MRDVFKGFLRLKLIGLAAVVFVGSMMLGISALSGGSVVVGVAIFAGVTLGMAAIVWGVTRGPRR